MIVTTEERIEVAAKINTEFALYTGILPRGAVCSICYLKKNHKEFKDN